MAVNSLSESMSGFAHSVALANRNLDIQLLKAVNPYGSNEAVTGTIWPNISASPGLIWGHYGAATDV